MIICLDCGKTFEIEEAQTEQHAVGEIGMQTAYEEFKTCPHCDSLFIEEATQCKACGEWKADCDMIEGVCEKCLRDSINLKNVMAVCKQLARDNEELNKFVLYAWGIKFINDLLEYSFEDGIEDSEVIVQELIEKDREVEISQYMLTKWVMNKDNRDIREKLAELIEEGRI